MVLQAQLYPSAGPQQGYVHKEEYYKNDNYNNGHIHKEDYYSNNSSMQMMRPNPSIHSPHGPNHHMSGHGVYYTPGGHHSHGHSMYPNHGSTNHGYGTHGSHMPMGPNRIETSRYDQHHHHASSGPHYGQHKNHSWISKDLDD